MNNKLHLFLIIFLLISTFLFSSDKACNKNLEKILSNEELDIGRFDKNRITSDFSNDCMIADHRISGSSGMRFDGKSINYCSGIWIADSLDGAIRMTAAEYISEFIPGAYGMDYNQSLHGITTFDESNTALDFLGDQLHWYICNGGVKNNHNVFNTNPLGVEVQTTIWGYKDDYNNIKLRNVMFVKAMINNKSNVDIENAYIGIWSDSDLGNAGDDFVGCDTTLNLGYCYNDGPDDQFENQVTPAHGIVLLQGPIVESLGRVARSNGSLINGYQNLPLTAFTKYG